jgi:oxygen-independent coproporphyrinogen-3 oxidase
MTSPSPPLSLYVHLPWCVRNCPYCDFNSHAAPSQIPFRQYTDDLLFDLREDLDLVQERRIISVFFGGGTPSLFPPEEIGRILDGARALVGFEPDVEITLEANPGTVEHGRFSGYRDAGVNRVSLGAQTFDAEKLHVLGRIHGPDDVGRAVDELVRADLENFNLDLMYALPAQTEEEALADVDKAIAFAPTHISHYQLTLEPGTVFYHRPPPLPDQELAWDMQLRCQARLAEQGYEQYEVSAYARAGRRCRHNLNYWSFGDYLGIGAGAHGKLTVAGSPPQVVRTTRLRQPREYLLRSPRVAERTEVRAEELPFEFMLNVLRLKDGFDVEAFAARTGLRADALAAPLRAAQERKLLERVQETGWRTTELGERFLNDVQALFLP